MKAIPKYISSLKTPRIAGFTWQDPEDEHDRSIFRNVLEYGCHIVAIEDPPKSAQYCFSIGFYLNLEHPEFIIMGLSSSATGKAINNLFRKVESGHRFSEGEELSDLFEGQTPCILKQFPRSLYFDYIGYACWFYRSLTFLPPAFEPKFPVLQVMWPDKAGRYPFEEGCDPAVVRAQAASHV